MTHWPCEFFVLALRDLQDFGGGGGGGIQNVQENVLGWGRKKEVGGGGGWGEDIQIWWPLSCMRVRHIPVSGTSSLDRWRLYVRCDQLKIDRVSDLKKKERKKRRLETDFWKTHMRMASGKKWSWQNINKTKKQKKEVKHKWSTEIGTLYYSNICRIVPVVSTTGKGHNLTVRSAPLPQAPRESSNFKQRPCLINNECSTIRPCAQPGILFSGVFTTYSKRFLLVGEDIHFLLRRVQFGDQSSAVYRSERTTPCHFLGSSATLWVQTVASWDGCGAKTYQPLFCCCCCCLSVCRLDTSDPLYPVSLDGSQPSSCCHSDIIHNKHFACFVWFYWLLPFQCVWKHYLSCSSIENCSIICVCGVFTLVWRIGIYYLCLSLPVEHRPSTSPRHRTLFCAALVI